MSSHSSVEGNSDGRATQPKNLKALLKFCMEATQKEDVPGTPRAQLLQNFDKEKADWLREALDSMTVSPVDRLKICLNLIEEAEVDTQPGTEQQVSAVEELQDWAEDIDIAKDFVKLNGLRIFPILMNSEVSELRWKCMELLGNLSQNNPNVQNSIISLHLLPPVLLLADTDPNPIVRVKAMYAISCLVRNNSEAQAELIKNEGLEVLLRSIQSDEEKLQIKSTFLITALISMNPALKDWFLHKGLMDELVRLLKSDHSAVHEHLISALLTLVSDNDACKTACLNNDLDLLQFLQARIDMLQGKEEHQDERENADRLLNILKGTASNTPIKPPSSNLALMAP